MSKLPHRGFYVFPKLDFSVPTAEESAHQLSPNCVKMIVAVCGTRQKLTNGLWP
jgi:hypothetical protein